MAALGFLVLSSCLAISAAMQVSSSRASSEEEGMLLKDFPRFSKMFKITEFNCSHHPWMCKEPFNCQILPDKAEFKRTQKTMATPDGHANVKTWCGVPQYQPNLARHCIQEKDLKLSAERVHTATIKKRFGPFTLEADASYCFLEGHCTNTAVTYNTTMDEAERMCDFRYGHEGWAVNFGYDDIVKVGMVLPVSMTPMNGFFTAKATAPFVKAACAMGNYHCDVIYCKDSYCKDPHYQKKYGHLSPKTPGHLIQQL
uniref:Uncharacterized protein n=1 Tax=Alexandrium andersonii TaxID=327968 RepID=A0A7S2J980_9DINO|mmetsp:Transcript_95999/g.215033  ORF Transcript_95999/g.215033 Transcript_95999/m.215033 type:complete len:256 (+) Transcript_95999:76-843(+)